MARHRTRKQKAKTVEQRGRIVAPPVVAAQELQVIPVQSFSASTETQNQNLLARKLALGSNKPSPIPPVAQSLLRVDQSFLAADLRRSVLVSLGLLLVLIGIFWLVRYNGFSVLQSLII
ncbi:hypothetical protein KA012_02030 [Candidatus Woesebacteria bacterium]|nr:hypothetical protein [Candidatus Woesebacteria bacterium]